MGARRTISRRQEKKLVKVFSLFFSSVSGTISSNYICKVTKINERMKAVEIVRPTREKRKKTEEEEDEVGSQ